MRRRAPPADEHSELSSAVLRLTTQWELKQQRKEAALQATLDEAREDAEELREELEELRQSLAAARREAGDAAASAARADAEAADAEPPAAAAAASDDDDDYDDDDRPPPADDGSESDRSAASSDEPAPAAGAPSEAARAAASRSRAHAAALGLARFLVAKCNARLDAVDDGGKTAAARAAEMRWSRTERALKDPSLLFWARATRANRLCKEGEHALALESYAQALAELERVDADRRPSPANVMTLHHNRGKSLMALGKHSRREALSAAVAIAGAPADYPAAADKRAECDAALLEHDKAAAAWEGLAASFAGETGDDAAATKAKFQRISAANDALEKRAADPYRPYDWAPHRDDDDDDDDDDDGHSDDDDDDDDDDAEFDRARRASRVASGPGYFEVFSNLRYWCYPARLAIFALWAKFSHAAVDACLVLEGRDDDELPEVALGCCALSKIDLDGAPVGCDA
ncbi:hypothetical protein JL722_2011 [Aureococcus anophagefferens]|nr:hypothetical protein JL722_2011 [Aureococcus anophagefferens]